jgi:hypothetical protein
MCYVGTTCSASRMDDHGQDQSMQIFLFRLVPGNDWNRHQVFVHLAVQIQRLHDGLVGLGKGRVRRVSFLPQKLASAQKGRGVLEFPRHHVALLSELERQIAVTLDPSEKAGYMMVSEVRIMAIGRASSPSPDLVTHATSGTKPSTWSFSPSRRCYETKRGK